MSRCAYAHDAVAVIGPGGTPEALGGAIATALCGHWDHQPPCPLAPHHVSHVTHESDADVVTLRVLFATEPASEQRVRILIGEALAAGALAGPDGRVTTWQLRSAAPGAVRPGEAELAGRLIAHGATGAR